MSAEAKPVYSFVLDKAKDAWICSVHGEVGDCAWVPCWAGCDNGYFDAYEDDPINCDEGDLEVCSECRGEGGWSVCPDCNLNNPDAEF